MHKDYNRYFLGIKTEKRSPQLSTWKAWKDYLRHKLVIESCNVEVNKQWVFISLSQFKRAKDIYDLVVDQGHWVHWYDITDVEKSIPYRCNCLELGRQRQCSFNNVASIWPPPSIAQPMSSPTSSVTSASETWTSPCLPTSSSLTLALSPTSSAASFTSSSWQPSLATAAFSSSQTTLATPESFQRYPQYARPPTLDYARVWSQESTVYVKNLPYSASKQNVKKHFESAGGRITSLILHMRPLDRRNRNAEPTNNGTATITYQTFAQADHAILEFDGKDFWDRPITVSRDPSLIHDHRRPHAQQPLAQQPWLSSPSSSARTTTTASPVSTWSALSMGSAGSGISVSDDGASHVSVDTEKTLREPEAEDGGPVVLDSSHYG